MKRHNKKLSTALALALGINTLNSEEPKQLGPLGYAAGFVVLCVGGICVIKLIKFCQKKFPKTSSDPNNTNQPPAFVSATGSGDEFAASWNYSSIGTCDPTLEGPDGLRSSTLQIDTNSATIFTISIDIDSDGHVNTKTSAKYGTEITQSFQELQAEVATHGIQVTGIGDGSQFYSINRVPCTPGEAPISFDINTKTINIQEGSFGPAKLVEVERSNDFIEWVPFLRTKIRANGRGLKIEDATVSNTMFYRVKVSEAMFGD